MGWSQCNKQWASVNDHVNIYTVTNTQPVSPPHRLLHLASTISVPQTSLFISHCLRVRLIKHRNGGVRLQRVTTAQQQPTYPNFTAFMTWHNQTTETQVPGLDGLSTMQLCYVMLCYVGEMSGLGLRPTTRTLLLQHTSDMFSYAQCNTTSKPNDGRPHK